MQVHIGGPVRAIDQQQQQLHTHQGEQKPSKELHPIEETVELHGTRSIVCGLPLPQQQ